jgi:branched-chain amino acid transport system substrate-binding protein
MGEGEMGEATGEPIKIGVQNLEGDPNGSFPEFSVAIQAAADYVNA